MELNELLKMCDEYFDGELIKNEESILFMSLSNNEEAKDYFKKQHILKNITREMQEEFPQELEEKILSKTITAVSRRFNWPKISPVFTYSVILILFFISLFFFNQTNAYKEDIAKIHLDIQRQNRTIESLIYALPTAEIKDIKQKEIIVRSTKL